MQTQTSIPLESFWNKKIVAIPLIIVLFFLIMGVLYWAGGESRAMPVRNDFKPQIAQWQAEYNKSVQEEEEAKIRKCEQIKQGAALKILANASDPDNNPLTTEQMADLMKKRDQDCTGNVAFIPTAKALSFETSSFNPQNNDYDIDSRSNSSNLVFINNNSLSVNSNVRNNQTLDLDKLAHAVAVAETSNCTKGSAKYNNCHGIRYNGRFAHYSSTEESFNDFKRIWAKSYKVFPTPALAARYTGNDHPDTWLNTVKKHYYF